MAKWPAFWAELTSIDDFLAWMQKQRETTVSVEEAEEQQLNGHISRYIGELYRHAKGYMKKVFTDTPFVSADDFGYLATLMREGNWNKIRAARWPRLGDFLLGIINFQNEIQS